MFALVMPDLTIHLAGIAATTPKIKSGSWSISVKSVIYLLCLLEIPILLFHYVKNVYCLEKSYSELGLMD